MPFNGVVLFENEPDRECWHEAGHAVVANHLGMTTPGFVETAKNLTHRVGYPQMALTRMLWVQKCSLVWPRRF